MQSMRILTKSILYKAIVKDARGRIFKLTLWGKKKISGVNCTRESKSAVSIKRKAGESDEIYRRNVFRYT
jgi:hypothetical protein